MYAPANHSIFPLGDTAVVVDFGNYIDKSINETVLALHAHLSAHPFKGFVESVPAYSSLTIHYNPWLLRNENSWGGTISEWVTEKVNQLIGEAQKQPDITSREISVPVCYEKSYAVDMEAVCNAKKLTAKEIIHLHTSMHYRVYMLGFLPGFAYMGEVDAQLIMPRKPVPQNIVAGSVGITGRQTGIYPLNSPGGWNIIGRTPLPLFESNKDVITTYFKAGDIVRFHPISSHEFENY
ncbi:MAG: 5-oxoprolinase subunit PxpB [Agriterribacter sp.]